ncbi:type 2 lanthipeptide synthetase LanM family protein [Synechococcus sp. NOUM97013]|uniref:type 2 lanthipeptide synthetase LanM family protein n=1 Tax=Synechococcus sp. NOUM97013 TaxID=1442555 RepID=UPI0016489A1A|nr:type 2 lanthipeptide synthetase LanM family protein [Synechococcus sp. NOUM97013]
MHQLLQAEKGQTTDSAVSCDDLNGFQQGLGQAWLDAIAPQESDKLARRFAWSGLDAETLRRVLARASNPEEAAISEPWWDELKALQHALRSDPDRALHPYVAEDSDKQKLPFADLWLPVVDDAVARLRDSLSDSQTRSFTDDVFQALGQSLLSRLSSVSEQVLFEQFNLLRPPGVMLLAHLGAAGDGQGPPVREYYERFIRQHRADGLDGLLKTFPVLGRYLGLVCLFWRQSNKEMLRRIDADVDALQQTFGIPPSAALIDIKQGLSDPHNGGQAVSVLTFATPNGDSTSRLVYKPKDMGVDLAYHQALDHLNRNSALPPLRTLSIHCGDDYGYMEFVEHRLCSGDDELKRFYRNAGRLTAVLHLFGCTDCHHENLIACGDQLLLIDTETLLEADLPDHISDASEHQTSLNQSDLQKRFQNSVLRSGLLPTWLFVGQARAAVDISALGIAPPASTTMKSAGWLGLNSDGMMAGRIMIPAEVPTSLPVGCGETNGLNRHLEIFCEGFREQCLAFEQTRDHWIGADGVLERFRGLPRRIVLRATRVYFALQRQQLEPAALRSPLSQGLVLEQLSRSFLMATDRPKHWPVFDEEVRQMERLDIPFFVHAIDGNDLPLSDGFAPVENFIETSGLESSRRRIETWDAAAVQFQEQLIRGTSRARVTTEQGWQNQESAPEELDVADLTPDQLRLEAGRLVDVLEEIAIRDSDGLVDWLGMDLGSDGEKFAFGPVGHSLYGGTAGVALLAAHFPEHADRSELLKAVIPPLLQLGEPSRDGMRLRWWRDQPLGLNGCGGTLLSLQQLAARSETDRRQSLQELESLLISALLPDHIRADLALDVIGGVAGLIGPLLQNGSARALECAVLCGDQLLQHQTENGGWSLGGPDRHPLLGFSHGTAGFAAALVKLGQCVGEARFIDAASRALVYERERFDADHGNWPDYRDYKPNQPNQFMTSWCHGAPGIALGRTCLFGTPLWDASCLDEMTTALQTLTAFPLPMADHLCCGTMGNASLLRIVAEGPWSDQLPATLRSAAIERSSQLVNQSIARARGLGGSFRCFGTADSNLLLPGCFTGLSGIGLALMDQVNRDDCLQTVLSMGLLSPSGAVTTAPVHESMRQSS